MSTADTTTKAANAHDVWLLLSDLHQRLTKMSSLGHTVMLVGLGIEQHDQENGDAVSELGGEVRNLADKASELCSQAMDLLRPATP